MLLVTLVSIDYVVAYLYMMQQQVKPQIELESYIQYSLEIISIIQLTVLPLLFVSDIQIKCISTNPIQSE